MNLFLRHNIYRFSFTLFVVAQSFVFKADAQQDSGVVFAKVDTSKVDIPKVDTAKVDSSKNKKLLYGNASFYANKFNGRKTASGEIFSQSKYTCACNKLPLGTWIKVTNLNNGKTVVVKVNDRLAKNSKRLVDLSKVAAHKLGFVSSGLTKVKVEVLGKKAPE